MSRCSTFLVFIVILFWTVCPAGNANAETVFTHHQDEIRGTLTLSSGEQLEGYFTGMDDDSRFFELRFRADGTDEFTTYRPHNIIEAETEDGVRYYSFSSELSRGAVPSMIAERIYATDHDLFTARDSERTHHFFVLTNRGQPVYLQPNRFTMSLRSMFDECGYVVRDYSDIGTFYGVRYLSRLFLEYDRCMGNVQDDTVRRYGTTINRSRFGIGGGLFSHKMTHNSKRNVWLFDEVSFGYQNSIDFSLFWDYRFGRRKLFVRPQLNYRSAEASAIAITSSGVEERASYKLSMYSLIVPLRYEFMYGPARPYATAGGSFKWLDTRENEYVMAVERPNGTIRENSMKLFELQPSFGFGMHAGLGVRLPELIGRADLFAEVRYSYHHLYDERRANIFDLAIQGFDISVAIGF